MLKNNYIFYHSLYIYIYIYLIIIKNCEEIKNQYSRKKKFLIY